MFNCFLCNLKFNNINYLIIHLSIYHNLNEIKEFVCKATNCLRSFSTLNSFKKHLETHTVTPNPNDQNFISCNSHILIPNLIGQNIDDCNLSTNQLIVH